MSLPRGPGTDGAGPAVAWGDRSDPRPIVSGPVSDASLKFLESSHREALDALHCEVQLLQQKNSGTPHPGPRCGAPRVHLRVLVECSC